jgi:hypothetical protein
VSLSHFPAQVVEHSAREREYLARILIEKRKKGV